MGIWLVTEEGEAINIERWSGLEIRYVSKDCYKVVAESVGDNSDALYRGTRAQCESFCSGFAVVANQGDRDVIASWTRDQAHRARADNPKRERL